MAEAVQRYQIQREIAMPVPCSQAPATWKEQGRSSGNIRRRGFRKPLRNISACDRN